MFKSVDDRRRMTEAYLSYNTYRRAIGSGKLTTQINRTDVAFRKLEVRKPNYIFGSIKIIKVGSVRKKVTKREQAWHMSKKTTENGTSVQSKEKIQRGIMSKKVQITPVSDKHASIWSNSGKDLVLA